MDEFDSILAFESANYDAGLTEGIALGEARGFAEGFDLGCTKGAEIGAELGFCLGCVSTWQLMFEQTPTKYSKRYVCVVTRVRSRMAYSLAEWLV
jgi:hypothetical protein